MSEQRGGTSRGGRGRRGGGRGSMPGDWGYSGGRGSESGRSSRGSYQRGFGGDGRGANGDGRGGGRGSILGGWGNSGGRGSESGRSSRGSYQRGFGGDGRGADGDGRGGGRGSILGGWGHSGGRGSESGRSSRESYQRGFGGDGRGGWLAPLERDYTRCDWDYGGRVTLVGERDPSARDYSASPIVEHGGGGGFGRSGHGRQSVHSDKDYTRCEWNYGGDDAREGGHFLLGEWEPFAGDDFANPVAEGGHFLLEEWESSARDYFANPIAEQHGGSGGRGSDDESSHSSRGSYRRAGRGFGRNGGRSGTSERDSGGSGRGSDSRGGRGYVGDGSGGCDYGGNATGGGRFCFVCGDAGHSAKDCYRRSDRDQRSSNSSHGGGDSFSSLRGRGGDARHHLVGGEHLGRECYQRSNWEFRGGGGGGGGGGRFTGGRGRSSCSNCRGRGHSAMDYRYSSNRDCNDVGGGRIGSDYGGRGGRGRHSCKECGHSISLMNSYQRSDRGYNYGHGGGSRGGGGRHYNTVGQSEHLSNKCHQRVHQGYGTDSSGDTLSDNIREPGLIASDCNQGDGMEDKTSVDGDHSCFMCGEFGHLARDCPCSIGGPSSDNNREPGSYTRDSNQGDDGEDKTSGDGDLSCFMCGELGHLARDCPHSIGDVERCCLACGEMGHSTRDCTHSDGGDQTSSGEDDNNGPCEENDNMEKFVRLPTSLLFSIVQTHEEKQLEHEKSNGSSIVEAAKEEEKRREEEDDECCILDHNPFEQPTADLKDKHSHHPSESEDEDVSVTAARGQVACRDYPHSRHLCGNYPFSKTAHERCCPQCYCYVCDVVAPCEYWTGSSGHCHASDHDSTWSLKRTLHRFSSACKISSEHGESSSNLLGLFRL